MSHTPIYIPSHAPQVPPSGGKSESGKVIGIVVASLLGVALVVFGVAYATAKAHMWEPNLLFVNDSMTRGIDVSEHQGDVDFSALPGAGVRFVYAKATEGSSYVDSRFGRNWEAGHASGIPMGAYHFFSFDSPGATQAENFLSTVGEMGDADLVPAVDIEWYGDKESNPPDIKAVQSELHAFLDTVEAACGAKPIIYVEAGLYDRYILGEFEGYRIWVGSLYQPVIMSWGSRGDWAIWQYSNRRRISGAGNMDGHVDMDVLADGITVEDLTIGASRR